MTLAEQQEHEKAKVKVNVKFIINFKSIKSLPTSIQLQVKSFGLCESPFSISVSHPRQRPAECAISLVSMAANHQSVTAAVP
jgi:hypothetical protein